MVEAAAAKAHWKSQKEKGWKSEKFIDNANWPHPMKPLDVWCLPHTPYAKPYPMSLRMGAGEGQRAGCRVRALRHAETLDEQHLI